MTAPMGSPVESVSGAALALRYTVPRPGSSPSMSSRLTSRDAEYISSNRLAIWPLSSGPRRA